MQASDDTLEVVRGVLARALQLGPRAKSLQRDSGLLGALPELDSMAVVGVLAAIEEHFGFSIDDDEITAETFASFGRLADFVERKLAA